MWQETIATYFAVLFWNLRGGTEKKMTTLTQDSLCSGRDWNQALPEYMLEASPFESIFSVYCWNTDVKDGLCL
jgi:hypothetical protein